MHHKMQLSGTLAGTSHTDFTVANVVQALGVLATLDHHVCRTDVWKPMAAQMELARLCSQTAVHVTCDGRYMHIMSYLLMCLSKTGCKGIVQKAYQGPNKDAFMDRSSDEVG